MDAGESRFVFVLHRFDNRIFEFGLRRSVSVSFASYLNSHFFAVLYLSERSVSHNFGIIFGMLTPDTQDRENESRFGATPVPGKIGMAIAGQGLTVGPPRPAYHDSPGNQLYVGNASISSHFIASSISLPPQSPYQAGWQDLNDLFKSAGNIIRADINIGVDSRPKGSGTEIFETSKDAQQAISASYFNAAYDDGCVGMYNGFDW